MENQIDKVKDLAEMAAEAEKDGLAFMEPQLKKEKSKRGRPKKSEQKAKAENSDTPHKKAHSEEPQIPTKEIIKPLCVGISKAAESWAHDPRAGMTPDELEAIAACSGALLDKYMPDMLGKYGLEAAFVLTMGAYGTRVYALRKLHYLEEKERRAHQAANESVIGPDTQSHVPEMKTAPMEPWNATQ